MTEEAKRDWLAVAWGTLKHLPADLLASGCRKAREHCDHPSKIVPTIVEATKDSMRFRHEYDHPTMRALPEPEPEYCSAEEAKRILAEYGLKRDWSGESSTA